MPIFLMILLTLYVLRGVLYMIKRGDDFYAISFFSLYLYTIFTQIGYAYFPYLVEMNNAYFGTELYYKYWLFIFLSFVMSFVIYRYFSKKQNKIVYKIKPSKINKRPIFIIISLILFLYLSIYFYSHYGAVEYGGEKSFNRWFSFFMGYFCIVVFVLYVMLREKVTKNGLFLLIIYLLFFIQFHVKSGDRSGILTEAILFAVYELSPIVHSIKKQRKKIFKILICMLGLLVFLQTIAYVRSNITNTDITISEIFKKHDKTGITEKPWYEDIMVQDYFVPSQTLLVSMYYDYIVPDDVLKSNLFNCFLGTKYALITHEIVTLVDKSDYSRDQGWAYYFFTEGFNFMGNWGFIYNGIMLNLYWTIFLLLTRTNNRLFKKSIYALVCSSIFYFTRTQGYYAVVQVVYFFIPAVVMLIYATNSRICFPKKIKTNNKIISLL